ncbi:MAG: 6-phosphofructokinase [Phycisphaerae bacterium]|jgi:6-phosphofructokinase 1|nr:6-phosphofructokinase [Phycisphaerae bacterium]
MPTLKGKAVVAQSGGPTAVINASAAGVIQDCLACPDVFTGVYGSLNGILGILTEDLFDMSVENPAQIDLLRRSPASALGSCRHKLKDLDSDRADYERILEVFKAHDIRYFFYIGGNDSMDTAAKLGQLAIETDYEMIALGVPKTVDNDLACTDHCPGYGSVARYSAMSVMEAGRDTDAMYIHTACTIHEVMGRNAGWIAAATGLARRRREEAPHIILLPEVPFIVDKFVDDVRRCITDFKRCFITCGEGVRTPDGQYLADAGGKFVKDSFGHTQLGGASDAIRTIIESHINVKTRANRPGTAQRVAMHFASKTDVDEAYLAGQAAVAAAVDGVSGKMITLVRNSDSGRYVCTTGLADLEDVANGEKMLPPEFIDADGTGITEAFRQYALPLIQGEAPLEVGGDGLPVYARLDRTPILKLTPPWGTLQ